MSAREEFEEFVKRFGPGAGHAMAFPSKLQAVLDEHAHEAAEKLRAHARSIEANAGPHGLDYTEDHIVGAYENAADLIDPQVK